MSRKILALVLTVTVMICAVLCFYLFNTRYANQNIEQPKISGAMEALSFWTKIRAYPEKDIPIDTYFKEYKSVSTVLSKQSQALENETSWETIGPYNVPGRMISLAVNPQNPNTLYAGGASGGLWVTHAAATGANWQQIPTGYPTLGVMAIAIDPTDTNKIYIGTGEVYGFKRNR